MVLMKRLLSLLLTVLIALTLVGCNSNDQTTVGNDSQLIEPSNQEEILGGYVEVEDGTLTDELNDIFDTALEGLIGANYKAVKLISTQVVSGTNYKFLAEGTKTTNPITSGTYYVTIYQDLQGNVELLNIETIEEKQDEALDLTGIKFWVVFYNPDGMELYRTAIKYGTTPTYEGEKPVYWDSEYWYRFVCWTDKDGNEIEEFTPITGNTYIYAKYEIGGSNKPEPASNTVSVTLFASGENGESFDPEVGSLKCAKGSSFSISGDSITINNNVYTLTYEHQLFSILRWEINGVEASSSGIIEEDTEIIPIICPV